MLGALVLLTLAYGSAAIGVLGPTCASMRCRSGSVCIDMPEGSGCYQDMCPLTDCASGLTCSMQYAPCLVAPCTPQAVCSAPVQEKACMWMKCSRGFECRDLPGGSRCVPVSSSIQKREFNEYNVCAGHRCPRGQKCKPQQVQCFRAPCYPIPQCVAVNTCASTTCPMYTDCIDLPGGARCEPRSPTEACAAMSCLQGTRCEEIGGRARCIPDRTLDCRTMLCPAGQKCVTEQVRCFVPPCADQSMCVPI